MIEEEDLAATQPPDAERERTESPECEQTQPPGPRYEVHARLCPRQSAERVIVVGTLGESGKWQSIEFRRSREREPETAEAVETTERGAQHGVLRLRSFEAGATPSRETIKYPQMSRSGSLRLELNDSKNDCPSPVSLVVMQPDVVAELDGDGVPVSLLQPGRIPVFSDRLYRVGEKGNGNVQVWVEGVPVAPIDPTTTTTGPPTTSAASSTTMTPSLTVTCTAVRVSKQPFGDSPTTHRWEVGPHMPRLLLGTDPVPPDAGTYQPVQLNGDVSGALPTHISLRCYAEHGKETVTTRNHGAPSSTFVHDGDADLVQHTEVKPGTRGAVTPSTVISLGRPDRDHFEVRVTGFSATNAARDPVDADPPFDVEAHNRKLHNERKRTAEDMGDDHDSTSDTEVTPDPSVVALQDEIDRLQAMLRNVVPKIKDHKERKLRYNKVFGEMMRKIRNRKQLDDQKIKAQKKKRRTKEKQKERRQGATRHTNPRTGATQGAGAAKAREARGDQGRTKHRSPANQYRASQHSAARGRGSGRGRGFNGGWKGRRGGDRGGQDHRAEGRRGRGGGRWRE